MYPRLMRLARTTAALAALFLCGKAAAAPESLVVFRWSLPEQSIEDARFSADGRLVAFVTQMNVPDGIEAEEYDYAYGEGWLGLLAERAKREPRFQDPIVRAVDGSGREICAAGYGWSPDVRAPGPQLVYSEQVQPISLERRLADTLKGDRIVLYDCATKTTRILATPTTGYLDNPQFGPRAEVLFTYDDVVNGSYGGAVGLAAVPLGGGAPRAIVPPRVKDGFPWLVSGLARGPRELTFAVEEPLPQNGDEFMASDYKRTFYRYDLADARLAAAPQTAPRSKTSDEDAQPAPSPDGKFVLIAEPHENTDATRASLWTAGRKKRLVRLDPKGLLRAMFWSPDGSRFALVVTKLDDFSGRGVGKFHFLHDELIVYRTPKAP